MLRSISRLALATTAAVLLAVPAAPAAASVGLGNYVCNYFTSSGLNAAGSIQIVAEGTYTINRNQPGSFTYDPATGAMTFTSGDYQKMTGVYRPNEKVIDISDKEDGDYSWSCNWQEGSDAEYAGAKPTPTPAPSPSPAPSAPVPPAPAAGAPASDDAPAAGPAMVLKLPRAAKLASLARGLSVAVALDRPAALSGTATLSARDARRYGLGRRAVVIARATAPAGAASVSLKASKQVARKLRRAKRLRLKVAVLARDAAGATSRKTATLTLTR